MTHKHCKDVEVVTEIQKYWLICRINECRCVQKHQKKEQSKGRNNGTQWQPRSLTAIKLGQGLFTPPKASTQLRPSTGDPPEENPCSENRRVASRSHYPLHTCLLPLVPRGAEDEDTQNGKINKTEEKNPPKIHRAPSKQNSQAKKWQQWLLAGDATADQAKTHPVTTSRE